MTHDELVECHRITDTMNGPCRFLWKSVVRGVGLILPFITITT